MWRIIVSSEDSIFLIHETESYMTTRDEGINIHLFSVLFSSTEMTQKLGKEVNQLKVSRLRLKKKVGES